MLTKEKIEQNKQIYIDLISQISRDGFRKSEFIEYLCASDFFTAPASSKYHAAYPGGLCEHSLNVFYNLVTLATVKHMQFPDETIIIAALCHDLSKIGFYKKDFRNKKVYSTGGSKRDAGGNYDWETIECYTIIPDDERFVYNNHETTAEYIAGCYIPLNWYESTAIMTHMGGLSKDSVEGLIQQIYPRNELAVALHLADTMATYFDEERSKHE